MTEIETDRLLLRRWREEDLEGFARMCADPEVMRYLMAGKGTPISHEQTGEQIAMFVRHWEERGFGLWAAEEKATGGFVGRIGLAHQDDWPGEDKVEVSWVLDRSVWGRGLATEGTQASLRHGFEELELERIISIAWPENQRLTG